MSETNGHAWVDDASGGLPWESCTRCGQRRRRVEGGHIFRVSCDGRERQVRLPDNTSTTCGMAVRLREAW